MIWIAYLILIAFLTSALIGVNGVVLRTLPSKTQQLVRALSIVAGLVVAGASLAYVVVLTGEPHHSFSDDSFPYYFLGTLSIGGLSYAAGAAAWFGRAAHLLRAVGWALMVVPLAYPTTLTLALPLVGLLVVTVTRIPPGQNANRGSTRGAVTARA